MRCYFNIDPLWSYYLKEQATLMLPGSTVSSFMEHMYSLATDYLKLTHNFSLVNNGRDYSGSVQSIINELTIYPLDPGLLQTELRRLYHIHICAFRALPGCIMEAQALIDNDGLLTGYFFVVDDIRT